jgi:hypothetical protein
MSWLSGWSNRDRITIDHTDVTADLSDFPIKVIVPSTSDLFTVGKSDGADVRFTSADGKTLLDFEREVHDDTNSIAVYHVKIPLVSSTSDTEIYLYYGNASATDASSPTSVWDSDYKLVLHMDGSLKDSTSNGNDGTNHGSTLGLASDGYYRSFDGVDDYVDCGTDSSLFPNNITIEAWVRAKTLSRWNGIISNLTSWGTGFGLQMGTEQNIAAMVSGTYLKTSWQPSTEVWYHIAATHDATTNLNVLYVNGIKEAEVTRAVSYEANPKTYIGVFYTSPSLFFDGLITEVRISSTARSDAWIKATSESLSGSLITFEEHESVADWLAKQSHMLAFNF